MTVVEETEQTKYARPDVLVETDWVQAHLTDRNVRLIEVDVDTAAYDQGHIQGAVAFNWQTQLQDQLRRGPIGADALASLLGSIGVTPDTTVILYGDNNNWFAAWLYWQLKYYGHKDVRLLNGGRKKWLALDLPLTSEQTQISPTEYPVPNVQNKEIRALRNQVLDSVEGGSTAFVDVRSPDEFSGKLLAPANLPQEGAQRGGHIPGAKNVPWAQAVNDDGTFKSVNDLRALYEGKGVTPDKDVIAYCRIGERSSHTWFVLTELLGYKNVRNYDGSWTEYGSLIDVPIEKG